MKAQRIERAVALVTGANRGIGRALTEALLTRGVRKVYATARNPEALRALRDERLVALRLDVTDELPGGGAGRSVADVRALDSAAPPSRIAGAPYGLRHLLGRALIPCAWLEKYGGTR
jgi:NAD(P)-dependent dehydrogenase (short-subunit alcohol dehydrogenase family)